jgi:four helix bundle protein
VRAVGNFCSDPLARDSKFRDQLHDTSASAPRNIAEGFGRFRPREFAQFRSIARASLVELQNHLIDARDRGYLPERDDSRLMNLAGAAIRTTTRLMRYHQARSTPRRNG